MPAEQDKPVIIDRARQLLADARRRGVHLRLAGSRYDDGWLYLVVAPAKPGDRASDHARLMTQIERTLLKEGHDQVLLVPSLPEHDGLIDVPEPEEAAPAAFAGETGEVRKR